jgi:hypothetical protein
MDLLNSEASFSEANQDERRAGGKIIPKGEQVQESLWERSVTAQISDCRR